MGRARYPWVKVWIDCLSDPKMCRLTLAEFGVWIKILLLAQQSPVRGKLMISDNIPMTISDLIRTISGRIENQKGRKSVNSLVQKMIEFNSLVIEDGAYRVVKFIPRQDIYPSDSKLVINSELTPSKLRVPEQNRTDKEQNRTDKEILKKKPAPKTYSPEEIKTSDWYNKEFLKRNPFFKETDFKEALEWLESNPSRSLNKAFLNTWAENMRNRNNTQKPTQHKPGQRVPEKYMTPEEFLAKT